MWIIEPQGMRFLHVPDTFEGHFQGVPVIAKGQQKVLDAMLIASYPSGHRVPALFLLSSHSGTGWGRE